MGIHPRKNHKYYYVCMSTAFINRETKSCWIHILLTCVNFYSPSLKEKFHELDLFFNCAMKTTWKLRIKLVENILNKEIFFFFYPEIFILIFIHMDSKGALLFI